MPEHALLTVLLTDDVDAAAAGLRDRLALGPERWFPSVGADAARLFGWPPDVEDARRVVFGRPPGLVELVEIPPSLRATVRPGLAFVGFGVPDLAGEGCLEFDGTTVRLRRHGGLPIAEMRFTGG